MLVKAVRPPPSGVAQTTRVVRPEEATAACHQALWAFWGSSAWARICSSPNGAPIGPVRTASDRVVLDVRRM